MVAIDERLKKLRYELGLDWGELAKTLEISRSMLGFVRHGTKPVSAKLLYRITQLEKKSQLGSTQIAPHAAEQVAAVRETPATYGTDAARIAELEAELATARETIYNLSVALSAAGRVAAAPASGASGGGLDAAPAAKRERKLGAS